MSCDERAWHAGASSWQGRAGCNDFSIGIELEGLEGETFEAPQYDALGALLREPRGALSDPRTSPATSTSRRAARCDPGPGFDWRARGARAVGLRFKTA